MATEWAVSDVSRHIQQAVQDWKVEHLVTFDVRGVSEHVNHVAVHYGVR